MTHPDGAGTLSISMLRGNQRVTSSRSRSVEVDLSPLEAGCDEVTTLPLEGDEDRSKPGRIAIS